MTAGHSPWGLNFYMPPLKAWCNCKLMRSQPLKGDLVVQTTRRFRKVFIALGQRHSKFHEVVLCCTSCRVIRPKNGAIWTSSKTVGKIYLESQTELITSPNTSVFFITFILFVLKLEQWKSLCSKSEVEMCAVWQCQTPLLNRPCAKYGMVAFSIVS